MNVRLAILDAQQTFAEALGLALSGLHDMDCVATATTISEFVELCSSQTPDVALIDCWLSDGTALECAKQLRDNQVESRLILTAAHLTPVVTRRCLDAGFDTALTKNLTILELANEIRLPGRLADRIEVARFQPIEFSRRQQDVLELMGRGLDTVAIADAMFVSHHTTRSHVKAVLRLLDAPNRLAAVLHAERQGYLPPLSERPRYESQ